MASLSITDVHKRFGSVDIIRGVSLEVEDGEFAVLVGPSGCGKSTLLRMTIDDVMSSFKAGTTATTILGSFRVAAGRASASTGANLVTAPIPGWTADKPSPARLAGQTLTIGANTKHRDGAWRRGSAPLPASHPRRRSVRPRDRRDRHDHRSGCLRRSRGRFSSGPKWSRDRKATR